MQLFSPIFNHRESTLLAALHYVRKQSLADRKYDGIDYIDY